MNTYPPSPYPGQNPWSPSSNQPSQPGPAEGGASVQAGPTFPLPTGSQSGHGATLSNLFTTPPTAFQSAELPRDSYTQTPRKRKLPLWWAIVLLLIVLAVAGGSYAYFTNLSTPQKTLQEYCAALTSNNAQAFYDTLSSEQQAKTTVSDLQQDLRLLHFLTDGFKTCTVDTASIQQDATTASAAVNLLPAHGSAIHSTVRLTEEQGTWRIAQSASLP